jgi:hypothetical protein
MAASTIYRGRRRAKGCRGRHSGIEAECDPSLPFQGAATFPESSRSHWTRRQEADWSGKLSGGAFGRPVTQRQALCRDAAAERRGLPLLSVGQRRVTAYDPTGLHRD